MSLTNKTWVSEDTVFVKLDNCPDTDGLFCDFHLKTFEFVVVEEVAVLAWVELVSEEGQKSVVELELGAHLVPELMDAV